MPVQATPRLRFLPSTESPESRIVVKCKPTILRPRSTREILLSPKPKLMKERSCLSFDLVFYSSAPLACSLDPPERLQLKRTYFIALKQVDVVGHPTQAVHNRQTLRRRAFSNLSKHMRCTRSGRPFGHSPDSDSPRAERSRSRQSRQSPTSSQANQAKTWHCK